MYAVASFDIWHFLEAHHSAHLGKGKEQRKMKDLGYYV